MNARRTLPIVVILGAAFLSVIKALPMRQQSSVGPTLLTLEAGKPIERALRGAESHDYGISLQSGQFLRVAVEARGSGRLRVKALAPDDAALRDDDVAEGSPGLFVVAAKASGTYRISVQRLAAEGEQRYEIRLEELLSRQSYEQRRAALTGWVKANAVPLDGVEAGRHLSDLQRLKTILKDVRLVGLGEATHGAREFFQVKHRLVEFLVREMGFRVFAIESSYSESTNVNDFVMGRTRDGGAALASLNNGNWDTDEMLAMLEWMRTYNAGVPIDQRVKFVGFDQQYNVRSLAEIPAYLQKVAPKYVPMAQSLAALNLSAMREARFRQVTAKEREDLAPKLEEAGQKYLELFGFLAINEARLVRATSRAEYEHVRESVRYAAQEIETARQSGPNLRAEYMAENLRRLVESEPPGTRIIFSAHNVHVSNDAAVGSYPSAGYFVRRLFGAAYYGLGLTFGEGSFQQRDGEMQDGRRMMRKFTTAPAYEGSIEWHLAQAGAKALIIDLRSGRNAVVTDWLSKYQPFRYVGGFASKRESFLVPHKMLPDYDGLLFIDQITRAHPSSSVPYVDETTLR